jgi:hypothetical protein
MCLPTPGELALALALMLPRGRRRFQSKLVAQRRRMRAGCWLLCPAQPAEAEGVSRATAACRDCSAGQRRVAEGATSKSGSGSGSGRSRPWRAICRGVSGGVSRATARAGGEGQVCVFAVGPVRSSMLAGHPCRSDALPSLRAFIHSSTLLGLCPARLHCHTRQTRTQTHPHTPFTLMSPSQL